MKKILTILLGTLMTGLLVSCEKVNGEGPVVTETRNRGSFSGVDLRVSANVYVTQDSTRSLEVRAQQNILDILETYVADNKLVIKYRDGKRVRSNEEVTVTVHTPALNSLRVSGSGNITAPNAVKSTDMDMDISGSGNIHLQRLETGYLGATISGSGNIRVPQGAATDQRLRISGSGNIDLEGVGAKTAATTTSGSGDIRLQVADRLDVTISGSGSVRYWGRPLINSHISGSGKVTPL
ncbi:head GIN domain-containing protein [Paraflavisolibacter sp. H34]|uniref:head GIN domain-containing protein n=1 Tax=Huijunlia imazamoxiresistens TaxID=3127457 RepID=UPI00301B4827